jgi:hypothetical protein
MESQGGNAAPQQQSRQESVGGGGPMFAVFRRDPGPRFLLAQPVGAMGVFFSCVDSV